MTAQEPKSAAPRINAWKAIGTAVLFFPVLLYGLICTRTSVNIPYRDDYDSIGFFLEHFVSLHGIHAKLRWFLSAQHVQYKLFFLQAVTILQYFIAGHTNYRVLQLIGDFFIPATLLVLWFMLSRGARPLLQRIWLFAIPCYLLLAVRYTETMNWAMSGLQNLAILPIGLATVYFATSTRRHSILWTGLFLVLSISASGNGFFVVPVVVCLFIADGRRGAAAWMLLLSAGMGALYALHYHFYMLNAPIPLSLAVRNALLFPLCFLGSCVSSSTGSALLGICLIAAFIVLVRSGWYRACPASFSAAVFCLITAAGVTVIRYRAGLEGALAGRYVIYSLLFISLEYIGLVRLFVPRSLTLRSRGTATLAMAGLASIAFCLWADILGYRDVEARKKDLVTHLILWERYPDHLVVVADEEPTIQTPAWVPLRISFQNDIRREIAAGLYVPPYKASDPLPIRPHTPATLGIEDEPFVPGSSMR